VLSEGNWTLSGNTWTSSPGSWTLSGSTWDVVAR